ncbi:hypothetical protein [Paramagnetospirillum magnetotacticum]|uniref:hypothetical protein n=1 Tax=Paramagnetospirillum magnetotacticum TaxID=188 RepID=UPI00126A7653|nr:hypothetical protein [Paramagnetospirillum magnetotacticum]
MDSDPVFSRFLDLIFSSTAGSALGDLTPISIGGNIWPAAPQALMVAAGFAVIPYDYFYGVLGTVSFVLTAIYAMKISVLYSLGHQILLLIVIILTAAIALVAAGFIAAIVAARVSRDDRRRIVADDCANKRGLAIPGVIGVAVFIAFVVPNAGGFIRIHCDIPV